MATEIEKVDEIEIQRASYLSEDFATEAFNYPQVKKICGKRPLNTREKLFILLGGQAMYERIQRERNQSFQDKAVKYAFLEFLFGKREAPVINVNASAPKEEKPKSFYDRLNAASLLPILASVMLAAAAWKTGETISWKNASDAAKQTVDIVKEQLVISNQEKRDLQSKNDALQQDMRDFLAKAAADSKTDVKTVTDGMINLLSKYKPPKTEKSKSSNNSASN